MNIIQTKRKFENGSPSYRIGAALRPSAKKQDRAHAVLLVREITGSFSSQ